MKKSSLLLFALIIFGMTGNAQHAIDMKLVNKALHQQTPSLRNDIAPSRAVYHKNEDAITLFRDNFSYDEIEYFLAEITTSFQDLGTWKPYSLTTYEYNYNLMPLVILTQKWEDEYVNDKMTTISYNDDDFNPLIQEELFQKWENGQWVNIKKHMYSYDPEQTILIKEWNGNNFDNQYLYTIETQGVNTTVLLQSWNGGAWMNEEKQEITYNHNHEIQEVVTMQWDIPNWINKEKQVYEYKDTFKPNKITKTLWENGAWSPNHVKTIEYTYPDNNSIDAICQSNYGGAEALNDDIELFYNDGNSIVYYDVHEVEIDLIDVTKLSEHTANSQFIVAPNPIEDQIHINGEHFVKAEIFTLTGQKVLESTTPVITLNHLSSGAYLLKIQDQSGRVETQKVLVK
jgi:hypothetical protein